MKQLLLTFIVALTLITSLSAIPLTQLIMKESDRLTAKVEAWNKQCGGKPSYDEVESARGSEPRFRVAGLHPRLASKCTESGLRNYRGGLLIPRQVTSALDEDQKKLDMDAKLAKGAVERATRRFNESSAALQILRGVGSSLGHRLARSPRSQLEPRATEVGKNSRTSWFPVSQRARLQLMQQQ